jgi:hypothetical protein
VALVGDALLAIDLWQAWPNTSLATLLKDDTVSEVNLTATQLDLQRASKLAGWNFPIAGTVDGSLTVSGAINALKTGGKLTVSKGRLPLGWSGDALTDVEAVTTFQGAEIMVESFTARQCFGDVQLGGTISLQNAREPQLHLRLTSAGSSLPLFTVPAPTRDAAEPTQRPKPILLGTALDLKIEGTTRAAILEGEARIQTMDIETGQRWYDLWKSEPVPAPGLPPLLTFTGTPWSNWQLNINCQTETPVKLSHNPGTVEIKTRLTGSCGEPRLEGSAIFKNVQGNPDLNLIEAAEPDKTQGSVTIEEATFVFQPERTRNPTLDIHASGFILGEAFEAFVLGPLTHLVHLAVVQPPLTTDLLQQFLSGEHTTASTALESDDAESL